MILIADSGSTKCDWALYDGSGFTTHSTQGFNPMFHTEQMVIDGLTNNLELASKAQLVDHIYYYGSGCQTPELNSVIENALRKVFPGAQVEVDHDLTAAIKATAGDEPGISCILGTGSNLAYFDGETIHTKTSGLGYILGDEGSGTYFGKKLVADFLYDQLPPELHKEIETKFNLSKDVAIQNVYMRPNANVYLASFMKVVSNYSDLEYVQNMVYEGLLRFIDVHVRRFDQCQAVPVHFVGSIAYYFQGLLAQACEKRGIELGKVVKKPIDSLVAYHENLINQA